MLKEILAISGQPGLFKLISKGNNSIIVESLLNGKRFPTFSTNKIISLEDIAIYTNSGEVSLKEIYKKILSDDELKKGIDQKSSSNVLKEYFLKVLPDYDQDRVYVSDMKKVMQWYKILSEKDLLNFDEETEVKSEE
jgi:ubiquinone biosynthesis protein Coq4